MTSLQIAQAVADYLQTATLTIIGISAAMTIYRLVKGSINRV